MVLLGLLAVISAAGLWKVEGIDVGIALKDYSGASSVFLSACKAKQHTLWMVDEGLPWLSLTHLCIWNYFPHSSFLDEFLLELAARTAMVKQTLLSRLGLCVNLGDSMSSGSLGENAFSPHWTFWSLYRFSKGAGRRGTAANFAARSPKKNQETVVHVEAHNLSLFTEE